MAESTDNMAPEDGLIPFEYGKLLPEPIIVRALLALEAYYQRTSMATTTPEENSRDKAMNNVSPKDSTQKRRASKRRIKKIERRSPSKRISGPNYVHRVISICQVGKSEDLNRAT